MDASLADMTGSDAAARKQRFAALLQTHQGLLRRLAWGFSRSAADRADLMQDMATQLWAVFPRWDEARPFSTWAYRVALNVALGQVRAADDATTNADSLDDSGDIACAAQDPAQNAEIAQLQRLMAALEPLNRALLLLYLDGLSYRDIGEVLGLSESNVGVRINRLKQRLRAQLEVSP